MIKCKKQSDSVVLEGEMKGSRRATCDRRHLGACMRLLSRLAYERSFGTSWPTYFVRIPKEVDGIETAVKPTLRYLLQPLWQILSRPDVLKNGRRVTHSLRFNYVMPCMTRR